MNPIILSDDQLQAVKAILAWCQDATAEPQLTLGGLAGTGKTTIIRYLLDRVGKVSVCALTGKAAYVLRTKGVPATTLHSFIYQPSEICETCEGTIEGCTTRNDTYRKLRAKHPDRQDRFPLCPQRGRRVRYRRVPILVADLIIVDEASMLNSRIVADLRSYGIKTLYVGDHGQLEPVGDDPGLMREPQLLLEKIHRQAAGSPIIQFAHAVREGLHPAQTRFDVEVRQGAPRNVSDFDMIICGYNRLRVAVNAAVRKRRGYDGHMPSPGESVICLRNDSESGVFNGMIATVEQAVVRKTYYKLEVRGDDGATISVDASKEQFGAERTKKDIDRDLTLWDYGYCVTAHKSQGSEWPAVCVLEQIASMWSASRWRYTAATRAAQRLTYCVQ